MDYLLSSDAEWDMKTGRPNFRELAHVERFDFEKARRFDIQHKEVAPDLPSGPLGRQSHSVIDTSFYWIHKNAGGGIDIKLGISRLQAAWLWIRSATAAACRRPALFDYLTPAAMFVFALLSLSLATIAPHASPPDYSQGVDLNTPE